MSNKKILKKEKKELHKEISSLLKTIGTYKDDRRAHWKSFKKEMKNEIGKIKKSIDKLVVKTPTKQTKVRLHSNGDVHAKTAI